MQENVSFCMSVNKFIFNNFFFTEIPRLYRIKLNFKNFSLTLKSYYIGGLNADLMILLDLSSILANNY